MKSKKFNEVRPYTYWIQDRETGIKYVGLRYKNIRKNRSPLDDFGVHYFTSGELKKDFKANPNSFRTKLLFTYDSIEEAIAHELKLTNKAKDNKRYANLVSYPSFVYTPEVRKKMSAWQTGRKLSEEHKRNMSKGMKGRKISEETKIKLSVVRKGKKHTKASIQKMSLVQSNKSEEWKRKMSEANKGKESNRKGVKHSEESKRKMSLAQSNRSEETRRNMSEAHKGKVMSEKTRRKISKANKGKESSRKGVKVSEETKRKISEALKGRKRNV